MKTQPCPVCDRPIPAEPIKILPDRGLVLAKGKAVTFGMRQMAILEVAAAAYPHPVFKEEIMEEVYSFTVHNRPPVKILPVLRSNMRKKMPALGIDIVSHPGGRWSLKTELPFELRQEPY